MGSEGLLALNELRARNVLCDAVLRTEDGGVFPVHSTLLFIYSDLFRFVWLLMWFNKV
jgi:kelch-like protein 10